jgi:hypothetical protein
VLEYKMKKGLWTLKVLLARNRLTKLLNHKHGPSLMKREDDSEGRSKTLEP